MTGAERQLVEAISDRVSDTLVSFMELRDAGDVTPAVERSFKDAVFYDMLNAAVILRGAPPAGKR